MAAFIDRFLNDERGATAIEYGLIAALMSLIVFAAVPTLRQPILDAFDRVKDRLNAAGT